jgi:phospholipid transport system substrate-binding protein
MRTALRIWRAAIAGALALALVWPGGLLRAAAGEAPRSVAEQLDEALLEAMRNAEALGYDGRFEVLAPVLAQTFDYPFMARVSVGRHWRKMSKAEQAQLVEVFGRLSAATFAARFNGYGGEVFEITGEEAQPRGAVLVLNRLVKTDGDAVSINYLMRESEAGWRIVDVFLDAKYSEIAVKRSEYTAVIKRDGLAGLIEVMKQKINDFAASGEG